MKKNHPSSTKEHTTTPVFDIKGRSFIEWITDHGQLLLYILLGAFCLLFILYSWLSSDSAQTGKDYIAANEQFSLFENSEGDGQTEKDFLDKLTKILNSNASLQSKYDASLAQLLIDRNKPLEAQTFADQSFRRVGKDDIPNYVDFAKISLMMAQKDYQGALNQSIQLKEEMIKSFEGEENAPESHFGPFLFAYNLLRIAFLQENVGADADELKSWKEWQSYTKSTNQEIVPNIDRKPFFTLAQLFQDGPISLNQYIDMRLQKLSALQENG